MGLYPFRFHSLLISINDFDFAITFYENEQSDVFVAL